MKMICSPILILLCLAVFMVISFQQTESSTNTYLIPISIHHLK